MIKDLDWYKQALESAIASHDRVTQSYLQAETRLDAIRLLVSKREAVAEESLARMFGGAPFPAMVATGELRVILEEKL